MVGQGADIIDIGGESTRPGAESLSDTEELRRILPVIQRLKAEIATPLSVDTYKSAVAVRALRAGASIVNDISGLRFSPDMARVVADHGAAVVIMHIKGTPRDMQVNTVYDDVIGEICDYLEESIDIARNAGIVRDKIMIDPGIGFGKTLEHNLEILDRLDEFRTLGSPIVLAGEQVTEEFDLLVLCPALLPSKGSKELAKLLGLELDEDEFLRTKYMRHPIDSTKKGILVCGFASAPMDIPDSVVQASGVAARVAELIQGGE